MRYKEFKEKVEDWGKVYGYKPVVTVDFNYVNIGLEGDVLYDIICEIHKTQRCVIDLNWTPFRNLSENAKGHLFNIVTEFAATKPEDREDEKVKRYKFRHKYLGGRNSNYLKYDTVGGNWILGHDIKTYDFKGEFTIDELKEKFNSNLDDWEIIEVEE